MVPAGAQTSTIDMKHTFNLELGNQIEFKLLPVAFSDDLPKEVAILVYNKQFLGFANVFLEHGALTCVADIPEELFILAPVPVFEIEQETLHEDGKTPIVTKANLISIGLLPHKEGDAVNSLQHQQKNHQLTY